MPTKRFSWKRFTILRGGKYYLDFGGYLLDPDGEHSGDANAHLSPLSSYGDYRCAVLLGEPGIGKSTALEEYVSQMTQTGQQVVLKDLRRWSRILDGQDVEGLALSGRRD